jgi:hypothetical protein
VSRKLESLKLGEAVARGRHPRTVTDPPYSERAFGRGDASQPLPASAPSPIPAASGLTVLVPHPVPVMPVPSLLTPSATCRSGRTPRVPEWVKEGLVELIMEDDADVPPKKKWKGSRAK